MTRLGGLVLATALALPPLLARGDEPPHDSELGLFQLEQEIKALVVSVTKSDQTVEQAPGVIEVITRDQMWEWGYTSIADVLRHQVGFYVEDDHILPNVGVRGVSGGLAAESSIIKLMIDGHAVSFRSTSGNWLGPELIPLSAIERVEIIRGPASSLYGADAFLGVVNIITRTGEAVSGADLRGSLGVSTTNPNQPGSDLDLTAGGRRGGFEALVGIRLNNENRSGLLLPADSPAPNIPSYNAGHTEATGLDMTSRVGFAKLSYHLGQHTTFTLSGHLSSIDRGAEFSSWTQLANGTSPSGIKNGNQISLYQYTVGFNARTTRFKRITLTLDATYFSGAPYGGDRIEVNSDLFWVKRRFGYSGTDINLEIQGNPHKTVMLVGGVGFLYDFETLPQVERVLKADIAGLKAGDTLGSTPNPAGDGKGLYNVGAFLQAQWSPLTRLSFTGGVRYDYHSVYGSQPSGRLAVVGRLAKHMHLKVIYGGAFKAPSPLLLFAVPLQVGDVIGNSSLQPQYVHTVETQLNYKPWPFLDIRTGLAYNLLNNAAQFTQQGVNQVATNLGQSHSLSWETQIEASYKEWLKLRLLGAYNYTVRDTQYVGFRAQLIGNGNIIYPQGIVQLAIRGMAPKVPIRIGFDVTYVAPRPSSEANSLANGSVYLLPEYVMLDASLTTVGLQLIKGHETAISLSARNLLGVSGPDPGFSGFDYPLSPRTFWLQLRQQL
jgi:outer membrane receptor for ferrienterochelin and colicins